MLRAWDDEVVVFNSGTGNTHMLSMFAGEILRALMASEQGVTIAGLVAELAESVPDADTAELAAATAATLAEFVRLEIAETAGP